MAKRPVEPIDAVVPPQSLEAEQAALGAMLLERYAAAKGVEMLQPGDFYRDANRLVFTGIEALYRADKPIDLITLGEWLKAHEHLEAIGGTMYLTTLMTQVPTAAGIKHYVNIVREKALLRRVLAVQDEVAQKIHSGDTSVDEILDTTENAIFALIDAYRSQDAIHESIDIHTAAMRAIKERQDVDMHGFDDGLKSDLKSLNRLMVPCRPAELVVIAGRPSMGKSALAFQLAVTAAEAGARGLFFTLEMDAASLATRLMLSGGLDSWKLNNISYRTAHEEEVYGELERMANLFRDLSLRIIDATGGLKVQDVLHHCRREQMEHGRLDFIVVDYLQLMEGPEKHMESYERVKEISKGLKALAKKLRITVFAVSQLSRKVEDRFPPEPYMSDLRESGQLEQDADKILLLYRPGYYGAKALKHAGLESDDEQSTKLILAKQRNGPTGAKWVRFVHSRCWFYEKDAELPLRPGMGRDE